MKTALRWLGLDDERWARVGPQSLYSAAALVVVAFGLLALNRFGGLTTSAPRAFIRLTLVGVWGWIGLTVAIWLIARIVASGRPSLRHAFSVIGWAHVPLTALALVIFVAAVLMQFLGPGRVTAMFVLAWWFPAALVAGVRGAFDVDLRRAATIVVLPYLGWFAIVGLHLLGQVDHLL